MHAQPITQQMLLIIINAPMSLPLNISRDLTSAFTSDKSAWIRSICPLFSQGKFIIVFFLITSTDCYPIFDGTTA
jgi:hypothetical protein